MVISQVMKKYPYQMRTINARNLQKIFLNFPINDQNSWPFQEPWIGDLY